MTPARLLSDLWLAIVVLSLFAVAGIAIAWMWAALATVGEAARRRRLRAERQAVLRDLADCDLAEIDDALERILAEEHVSVSRLLRNIAPAPP